jgi:hypothetical protein
MSSSTTNILYEARCICIHHGGNTAPTSTNEVSTAHTLAAAAAVVVVAAAGLCDTLPLLLMFLLIAVQI